MSKADQSSPISADLFFDHVDRLYKRWATEAGKYESILVIYDKQDHGKALAAISWFFGNAIPQTTMLFTKNSITLFVSEKKINALSVLKDHPKFSQLGVRFLKKQKEVEQRAPAHDELWKTITGASASPDSPKVCMLIKDKKQTGDKPDEFENYLKTKSFSAIDFVPTLSECLAIKDERELDNVVKSGKLTTYFLGKMVDEIVNAGADKITHAGIAKKIENIFDSDGELRKAQAKLGFKVRRDDVGLYTLNVQSGGNFNLKVRSQPNNDLLKADCIFAGVGCEFNSYISFCTRTLLIDPEDSQKKIYDKVLQLQTLIINSLKPGAVFSEIYKIGAAFVKAELPDSEVPASFGYGVGLQQKENLEAIVQGNDRHVAAGMTLMVNCGFKNLKRNDGKVYAVQLTDVLIVKPTENEVVTAKAKKKYESISYTEEEPEKEEEVKKKKQERVPEPTTLLAGRTRRQRKNQINVPIKPLKERNEHQAMLKKQKLEELTHRLNENFEANSKKVKELDYEKVECYKAREDIPKDLRKNKIGVDFKASAILLPINGALVPFHISVLKNIVKSDEDKSVALRINFHTPSQGVVGSIKLPTFNETTLYIKELTYRNENKDAFNEVYKSVKELQKRVKTHAEDQKNKEEIVDQERLQLNKGKKLFLKDLSVKPQINQNQRKVKGVLQCHLNGFRYDCIKGETIDVNFSNIRAAFVQSCEKEPGIAALHFRLHEPIMIGKKKTEDVQFYTEVGVGGEYLDRGRRDEDPDEEEKERALRKKLDREFLGFAKTCEEEFAKGTFEFELPQRDYAFQGKPTIAKSNFSSRGNCLLQPTKRTLMSITDQFFVMFLEDVEIALFQRMYANLATFDLTLICKDFDNYIEIASIRADRIELVKDWLDRSNIVFYEMQKSMNMAKLLTRIRSNFKNFVKDGGWAAFDSDSEDENDSEDPHADSEFSPQGSEEQDESSESSESDFEYEDEKDSEDYSQDEEDLSQEGLSESEMSEHFERQDKKQLRKELEKEKTKAQSKRK